MSLIVSQYVTQNLMPAHQIADAFSRFSTDRNAWKESLHEVGSEHREWLADKRIAEGEEAVVVQQTLWYGWPILMIITVSLCAFCLWGMMGLSKSAVADYAIGVGNRRDEYLRFDIHRQMTSAASDSRLDRQHSV